MRDVMRLPRSQPKPRLPYPAALATTPEPDFRLIDWRAEGAPRDPVRVREEMHAVWHRDNPNRTCEYGSVNTGG